MIPSPEARRDELYSLMGDLPDRDRPVTCDTVGEEDRGSYILERLVLDLNGVEPVPAFYTRPKDATAATPTILYNHAHGGGYDIGKLELTDGRGALQDPPYAQVLAERGVSALCIDHWAFGERAGTTELEIFKHMLWHGRVMWGMMVYDSLRAMDYLASRSDVDAARIGTLGISMGSTMGWWAAALDERIKVCVDLCCLTDFDALIDLRNLNGHGVYYFVPSLLKHFSTGQINALIAPRAHLSLAGNKDLLTPPKGLDRIDGELKQAYADAGAPENWKLLRYECGHMETAAMRRAILDFLDIHL